MFIELRTQGTNRAVLRLLDGHARLHRMGPRTSHMNWCECKILVAEASGDKKKLKLARGKIAAERCDPKHNSRPSNYSWLPSQPLAARGAYLPGSVVLAAPVPAVPGCYVDNLLAPNAWKHPRLTKKI